MPASRAPAVTPPPRPEEDGPDRSFAIRLALLAAALVLVAVPFLLLVLFVEDRFSPLAELDRSGRDALHGYAVAHPTFVQVMKGLSLVGTSGAYWVIFTPVLAWLLWRRLYRLAIFVASTMLLSSAINAVVKILVHRTRPVLHPAVAHASGQSFPSGHAQSAIVAYGVLLLVFLPVLRGAWRRVAVIFAVAMVVAIGFSRIALGLHYVSDVLAGYVLGAAWLAASTAAFSAWRRERGRPAVQVEEGLEPEEAGRLDPRTGPQREPRGGGTPAE